MRNIKSDNLKDMSSEIKENMKNNLNQEITPFNPEKSTLPKTTIKVEWYKGFFGNLIYNQNDYLF